MQRLGYDSVLTSTLSTNGARNALTAGSATRTAGVC